MPRGRPRKIDQTVSSPSSGVENFHENSTAEREDMQIEQTVIESSPIHKTKGTRPGWKPAGQLPKLKAPQGWTAKWASCDPGKLSKLRAEGWEIMKPTDNKGQEILHIDVNDSGSITGELRYRDLVAVMLPKELKDARDEWLRDENKQAMSTILKDTDEKFQENGVETYRPGGQSGRIVIE